VSPISRTQAYAKVITLMVDRTLPAPTSIGVSSEPVLTFDTADDVAAWATALGAAMHSYSDPQYREHPREVGYDPDPIRPMNDTVSLDDDVNDDEPAVTR
jgi:hypothetical protein